MGDREVVTWARSGDAGPWAHARVWTAANGMGVQWLDGRPPLWLLFADIEAVDELDPGDGSLQLAIESRGIPTVFLAEVVGLRDLILDRLAYAEAAPTDEASPSFVAGPTGPPTPVPDARTPGADPSGAGPSGAGPSPAPPSSAASPHRRPIVVAAVLAASVVVLGVAWLLLDGGDRPPSSASDSGAASGARVEGATSGDPTASTVPPSGGPVPGIAYEPGTAPTFSADGITARITRVEVVAPDGVSAASSQCAVQQGIEAADGRAPTATCLVVQWTFDIDASFPAGEAGGLAAGALVGTDGVRHDQSSSTSGMPGDRGRALSAAYPLTSEGGQLHFSTGSNGVGFTEHVWQVPTDMGTLPG